MYHFFRRFERLAFGIVPASAIVCTGVLVVHRFGDALVADFVPEHAVDAGVPFALGCEERSHVGSCERLLAVWKDAQ
ncbi:hypothetical protein M3I54_24430 [Paraburkholderia sp. CNPSo 3274]|uniref:hypothetical protein n=1 Tax=Paraburkholderia sp. CNPSo 3274 TaxID=2940932 RepID=UPI0020B7AE1E|nr:hypothetical protein [Paraburkholderia sp. CNPSo 3274]MCP3710083.1 hypothetical protein [Paraburkholderia sp. CNPSo 3274]